MAYSSCSSRIGANRVRSNIDPTFYSLVGFGRSGGTTTTSLFLKIHTSFISVWTTISRLQVQVQTSRSLFSFWGDGRIVSFELFFFMFFPEVWRK
ncbi:hypothetical protein AMTRI_Chr03g139870 [Amborella trichopoda]